MNVFTLQGVKQMQLLNRIMVYVSFNQTLFHGPLLKDYTHPSESGH